jgi:hypothetical protein
LSIEPIIINGIEIFTFDRTLAYIGIAFTGVIAFTVYRLQDKTANLHHDLLEKIEKMTQRVEFITQQKASKEESKKRHHVSRIIEILKEIETKEEELKKSLSNYEIGDPNNELLKLSVSMNLGANLTSFRIRQIADHCRQLEDYVSDHALITDMVGFSDALLLPSEFILSSNMPQNEKELESLLFLLNGQLEYIQKFLARFLNEIK